MAHAYISCHVHYVFSTKNREKLITEEMRDRLWAYVGGIARENNMKALAIGGIEDHIHALIQLPSTLSIAKAIQMIKGGSSKWVNEEFSQPRRFSWQEGYGAFGIGVSQIPRTIAYIQSQKAHHQNKTFQEEFRYFLRRHGIEFDEQYVWG